MRYLYTMIAAVGLLLLGTMPAAADHAGEWGANGDSHVVDATTVHLEGVDTSVENTSPGVTWDEGVEAVAEYELVDGAECTAGEPRIFAVVDGATNKSTQCDLPDPQEGTSGTLSFTTDRAGGVDRIGLVYSPGEEDAGHVIISNLTIDGETVHFTNPEPEPEPCEWDDELVADDPECVEPEPEPTDEPDPDPTDTSEPTTEPSSEPTEGESTDEPESTTTDDTTPASTQETLPDTGVSPLLLVGGGVALVLVGGAAMLRSRRTE